VSRNSSDRLVRILAGLALAVSAASGAVTVKPVPVDPNNLLASHTVITTQQALLAATVDLGNSPHSFTFSWNFGDGSPATAAAPVSDIYDISATHTYTAAAGTNYIAVVTVTDTTNNQTATGQYPIVVQASTLQTRVNVAIDNGLWYLHKTMWRGNTTNPDSQTIPWGGWDTAAGSPGCPNYQGSNHSCASYAGLDATNTQAFEVSGHLETGPAVDPYTDDVARGLARLMYFLTPRSKNADGAKVISYDPSIQASRCSDGSVPNRNVNPPTCTAPATLILYAQGANSCTNPPCTFPFDGNNNQQMIISGNDSGEPGYQTGMLLTALVASGSKTTMARTGVAPVVGGLPGVYKQTYGDLVQDMTDAIGYCQNFGLYGDGYYDQYYSRSSGYDNGGGWEYYCAATGPNYYYDDNSVSQWNAIGLIAASRGFGIQIPQIVIDTNQVWTAWDQNVTPGAGQGQFGYDSWNDPLWGPWAVTPSGMVQLAMDGVGRTAVGVPDQRWNLAESNYRNNFCNSGGSATTDPKQYTYGMFSFTKSMEQHDPGGVLTPITFLQDVPGGTNPIDWYGAVQGVGGAQCDGVAKTLVDRQLADGSWFGVDYTGTQYYFETAWSVQMLHKASFTACVNDLTGIGVAGPTVNLSWTGIPAASSYSVQRGTHTGGPYMTIGSTASTRYSDNGTVGGTTYYYVLQPLNANATAICTSNETAVSPPAGGGGPNGNGLTVRGGDGGVIPLGNQVSVPISASGGTPPYSYKAVSAVPPGMSAGASVSGTPTAPGSYAVTVQVSDAATPPAMVSATATYSVFGFVGAGEKFLPPGITFSPYSATVSAIGGRPPFQYGIDVLPPGLSMNVSGTIVGTVTAPGTWIAHVTATDANGIKISTTGTFRFVAPPPLSVAPNLPPGTVGTPYNAGLTATGGAPPLTWQMTSGALPDGLTLQPTGIVAGMPKTPGIFSFGVRATDMTGASAVGSASITIAALPLTIITPSPLATGAVGVQYPPQMITATGGLPPYSFVISQGSLPDGLSLSPDGMITGKPTSTGSYSFQVTATDSAGAPGAPNLSPLGRSVAGARLAEAAHAQAASGSVSLKFDVMPKSTNLVLSAGSLSFTLGAGTGAVPAGQTVNVNSTDATTIPFSAVVPGGTPSWLTVSGGGTTPSVLTIGLSNAALNLNASATPYTGSVMLTCLNPAPCAGTSQTITVGLTVNNVPPSLSVPATLLSFTTQASNPQAQSQGVSAANTGGGTIGIGSVTCRDQWCTVGGVPASIQAGIPANMTVTVDPAGRAAGFYRTEVDFKTSAGPAVVPVTLFIALAGSMTVQPAGTIFQSVGGAAPNGGDTSFFVGTVNTTPVNWTASVLPGPVGEPNWLSVTTGSGTAVNATPGMVQFAINNGSVPNTAGAYYRTIRVSSNNVTNSPLDYQVVLNVSPAGAAPVPAPSPQGLLFLSAAGQIPPPQTVSLSSNNGAAISYTASASTTNGGNWLSVSPGSGSFGASGQSIIKADPSKLNAGVYRGSVTYNYVGLAASRSVSVTLIVPLASQSVQNDRPADPAVTQLEAAPGCTATQVVPAQIGLLNNFSQPTGWPTPVSIQLLNDCGDFVTNGSVVATFSNGDPALPLTLVNPATGLYTGTWTPRKVLGQMTVSTRATAPGFAPVTTTLSGGVMPNAAPLLAPNGTVNIFNATPGTSLAPGALVNITGTGLAASTAAATAPLPPALGGTQAIIGGIPAPLQRVSPTTLTAQVPSGLDPLKEYQVVVNANGALTTPATIQLSAASPGISASSSGIINATHADGKPVSSNSPAAPGETIVLTGAGLGATDTPVADGTAAPATPAINALAKPTVTINGEDSAVTFAGLQPGAVGIYQINVTVPADAPDGDLALVLTQGSNAANSAVLTVKKQ
jgi:uncharacterized protein (TIGR03437 family)